MTFLNKSWAQLMYGIGYLVGKLVCYAFAGVVFNLVLVRPKWYAPWGVFVAVAVRIMGVLWRGDNPFQRKARGINSYE